MGLREAFAAAPCRFWAPSVSRGAIMQPKRMQIRKRKVKATVSQPADKQSALNGADAVHDQVRRPSDVSVATRPMRSVPVPNHILDCVVKIFATHCEPNYALPWSMTSQKLSTSTGFIISERRILTNAHAVEHHTVVMIKRRGSDTKYRAKVVSVGTECDVAMLQVPDKRFWEEHENAIVTAPAPDNSAENGASRGRSAKGFTVMPKTYPPRSVDSNSGVHYPYLTAGGMTALNDYCMVVGYAYPGESISVTTGVTSRVEMQKYAQSNESLLAVQIDAAINSGNSGGPVLDQNFQVLGIAFQSIDASEAESVGYFIPWASGPVQHFLDDIAANGQYTGFPYAGFSWQSTENEYMREALGIPDDIGGVLVRRVDEISDAAQVLQKGDIITHIDSIPVSSAGTIPFQSGQERICFSYELTKKFVGEQIRVSVRRDSQTLNVTYRLPRMGEARLAPICAILKQPDYLICGGCVFQVLSEPFLRTVYGDDFLFDAPVQLIDQFHRAQKTVDGRTEIVVLSQILSADVNEGYDYGEDVKILHRFNKTKVLSLAHLAKLIDSCARHEKYFHFEHGDDELIVIDRKAAEDEAASILDTHCIPRSRSIGLSKKHKLI